LTKEEVMINYKRQLEDAMKRIDILTRLKVLQAREWDSPWYEGVYYVPHYNAKGLITVGIAV